MASMVIQPPVGLRLNVSPTKNQSNADTSGNIIINNVNMGENKDTYDNLQVRENQADMDSDRSSPAGSIVSFNRS